MNTIVMKMGKDDLQNLIKALTSQQVNNNNPYVTFAAKVKGVTVLVYTSGKVVFQGANAETIAEQFGYQSANHSTSDTVSGQNIPLIGSDEVGNGSYFGGLAVVASFVTPDDHALLKKLGVDDSKNLTDSKIRQIAPVLENNIKHKAMLLSPQKYNQVVGKGKMHNAVSVKVALHNQAIYLLLQDGVKPEKIVIDAFTSRKNYQKYLKNEANQFANPLTLEEKAEGKYLAVAVSSIIARNLFLENLDKLSQEVQYKLPSGAGSQSDKVASQILAAYGISGLEHTAKLHFANTQKAQALLKK
ncbi:ribonuclease HIII [Streptococcus macedonicus]|uniref:ribonuclease HIII n=1 Tax=Streptococcus macedonicus TaxID=59310 RepID=UPI0022E16833|nr:ribonuclease HIII [Streptococcus macedonicus]